jgi:hypothetical protein
MSEKNAMRVKMREFILGTSAGVSGAAALVQTAADCAEGACLEEKRSSGA